MSTIGQETHSRNKSTENAAVQNLKIFRRKKVILYVHLNDVVLNFTAFD